MSIFIAGFWVLSVICVVLFLYTRTAVRGSTDASFKSFQRTYLVVYLMAMAGDWLQGPYVYALYERYGMSIPEINILFVAGFGASMVVGTVVGSFADKYGRRTNAILYGILYGLSCITKHFNNFWVLMLGRLLGGTATSILYSAFESWLVYEHNKRGFDGELLGTIFQHAVFGNSIVAITAGLVAQQFANVFGYVAPFDVALTVLSIMCIVIIFTWTENYGDVTGSTIKSFKSAFTAIRTDQKILCLGLIQSLFEGSMYAFVLEWTPALTPKTETHSTSRSLLEAEGEEEEHATIPHGYIFAGFMVAIMIGSSLFKLFSKHTTPESFMRPVLFVSSIALVTPILFPGNQLVIFMGFLVFETCVGIFWPSISTMRGKYVPEDARATIMNFFRIPLNLIVVIILIKSLPLRSIFCCCSVFLLLATLSQQWLYSLAMKLAPSTDKDKDASKAASGEDDKAPLIEHVEAEN